MASWSIIQNKKSVLFIQRSKKTSRAGQWCFPGGGINFNESPEDACIREAKEETGLSVNVVQLLETINDNYYFICKLVDDKQKVVLKQNECSNYKWIQPENLLQLGVIMDLKIVIPLLISLGYEVNLTTEVATYISS